MPVPAADRDIHAASVATKAVLRAAEYLGMSARELSGVIGMSEATVSRMKNGRQLLDPGSKPFELALLLVRVFRSLDAITGGDQNVAQQWMRNQNTVLRAVPADLAQTVTGLAATVSYLDARRAVL